MPEAPGPVPISREVEGAANSTGFVARHPDLAYVFGPTVRALYAVGCLTLDLLTPLQILDVFPEQAALLLPVLVAAFVGLAYIEYRLYRRIWPGSRGRKTKEGPGVERI